MLVGGQDSSAGIPLTVTAGTERWNVPNSGETGVGITDNGAASVTITGTWTLGSNWCNAMGSFKAATGGGGVFWAWASQRSRTLGGGTGLG